MNPKKIFAVLALTLTLVGCSSSKDDGSSKAQETTTVPVENSTSIESTSPSLDQGN